MTEKRLNEILARCKAATPGPWYIVSNNPPTVSAIHQEMTVGDAKFIAHARDDIPDLLDALNEAEARAWAAREDNAWPCKCECGHEWVSLINEDHFCPGCGAKIEMEGCA